MAPVLAGESAALGPPRAPYLRAVRAAVEPQPPHHPLPGGAAGAVGHVEEAADAAEQRVLERIEPAIGQHHLPEHFNEGLALLRRGALVDGAGEAEELHRAP